jgi:hypothetical protein
MSSPDERLARYCSEQHLEIVGKLGAGKDGAVYQTRSGSAVKVHSRLDSYEAERDVYLRLLQRGITDICGLAVPVLFNFEDDLRVLEMQVVSSPYLVDFASAWLDKPPDFSQEVIDEWHDQLRESFGARFPDIMNVLESLANDAGVYMLDIHPHNVKFELDVL